MQMFELPEICRSQKPETWKADAAKFPPDYSKNESVIST